MLAVYLCHLCGDEFAVKEAKEPNRCPFCGDADIEFSHDYNHIEEETN